MSENTALMKILFIVPYVPNRIRVRPYNFLIQLAERGHEVTLATLFSGVEENEDVRYWEGILAQTAAFSLPSWRSYANSLAALPTSMPLQFNYCWQPSLADWVCREARKDSSFDVIHIEHLRGAKFGVHLKQRLGDACPPIVWDSVDCISGLFRQASGNSASSFSRWITRLDLGRTEKYEGSLVHKFERVLVTSKQDRSGLLELAGKDTRAGHIHVIPNGVDLEYFQPPNGAIAAVLGKEPATLVVSGKMSYHANVSMVLHFVRDVLPLIWQRRPDVKLLVVGKDPAPEIQQLAQNPLIEVTGTVEDIRPSLHRATLAVAPTVYGAGIQNKVLEAMACGLPVVSSPQAVSALSAKAGEEILVASNPEQFANAVTSLLVDPEVRARTGQAGRTYVEREHRWSSIVARLEEVYREAIDTRINVG